jgi:hypothetical protein
MDLFHFPFLADVWGTFSDWTMVFVTAVTARYIYKTFKAQLQVTKDQQELLKIERVRHRKQFEPVFVLANSGNSWNGIHNIVNLYIQLNSQHAFNVSLTFMPGYIFEEKKKYKEIFEYKIGHLEPILKNEKPSV